MKICKIEEIAINLPFVGRNIVIIRKEKRLEELELLLNTIRCSIFFKKMRFSSSYLSTFVFSMFKLGLTINVAIYVGLKR